MTIQEPLTRAELLTRGRAATKPGPVNAADRILIFEGLFDDYELLVQHATRGRQHRSRLDQAVQRMRTVIAQCKRESGSYAIGEDAATLLDDAFNELIRAIEGLGPPDSN